MITEVKTFQRMICEQIIIKALQDSGLLHHHDIINYILDFNADDSLNELRVALRLAYKNILDEFPYAAVGMIYKQLEFSASDLRERKNGVFYKDVQKIKSSKESEQGVWELK